MEFQYEKGRIYALDSAGKLIAEITFPEAGGIADIDHTFVDGALRGQGVAGRLVEAAVRQIRSEGTSGRVRPSLTSQQAANVPPHF